eukprot:m.278568 g.278568  ORF g.278568 m.278568 type:complete len:85 (+) comp137499_c0_seq1:22-276(+)
MSVSGDVVTSIRQQANVHVHTYVCVVTVCCAFACVCSACMFMCVLRTCIVNVIERVSVFYSFCFFLLFSCLFFRASRARVTRNI